MTFTMNICYISKIDVSKLANSFSLIENKKYAMIKKTPILNRGYFT